MRVGVYKNRLALGAALLAIAASAPATAQDQPAAADPGAESSADAAADGSADSSAVSGNDIVVTAQGRAQRLQDVPVSVSVVTGDSLVRSNIKTLDEVGARISNVRIQSGTGADQIYIRGIGSGFDPGFEQTVGTFLDGVYRGRSRSTRASLFDVDRVEVLKGPQGTFFGANASAGAVNITTKKPGDELSYNASALWGPTGHGLGYGEYSFEGGVSVPLADQFAVRVAGRVSGQDGWVVNDMPRGRSARGPNEHAEQGRISLRWEPSTDFRSDLRVDALRRRVDQAYPAEVFKCPPDAPFPVTANTQCGRYLAFSQTFDGSYIAARPDNAIDYHSYAPYTYQRLDFYETAWTNTLDVGSASLRSTTAYYYHDYWQRGHNFPLPVTGTPHGYDGFPSELGEKYRQFSQEVRLESKSGGFLEYTLGAYFSKSHLNHPFFTGRFNALLAANAPASFGLPADTPVTHHYGLEEHTRNLSGFGSATLRPVDGIRVNLGLRYLTVTKRASRFVEFGTSINDDPDTFQAFPTQAINDYFIGLLGLTRAQFPHPKRTDSKWLPSVGVQYDVVPDTMVYATWSRGFKGGGYGAIAGVQLSEFDPETVNAYEVGIKSQLLDRRLTVNVALFRSDYKNMQESTYLFGPFGQVYSVIDNVGAARTQGVEFSTVARASSWLTLRADVGYLDSHYIEYELGGCTQLQLLAAGSTPCFQNMAGKHRPYSPTWSGSIGADAEWPVGDGSLRVSPLLYFSSDYFHTPVADPLIREPKWQKVDLRVSYGPEDRRWEVAIVGKNLTNKETFAQRQPLVSSLGSVVGQNPEPGRSIAAQISVKY